MIWLDFMFAYYDDRRLVAMSGENGEEYAEFGMSDYRDMLFACKVDVGAGSYWSEISALNTLDNLLSMGRISTVQYLERIPDGLIPEKDRLIKELAAGEAAEERSNEIAKDKQ